MRRDARVAQRDAEAGRAARPPAADRGAASAPGGAPLHSEHARLAALQRAAGNHAVASLLGQHGRPLEPSTRSAMEASFGESFADVRVHVDDAGDAAARETGARAFALGPEIAFRGGEYEPDTLPGQRLIAHELAHVVQQRRGGDAPAAPSEGGDAALEGGARAAADAVTVGAPVSVSGASAPGVAADKFEDDIKKQLGISDTPVVIDLSKYPNLAGGGAAPNASVAPKPAPNFTPVGGAPKPAAPKQDAPTKKLPYLGPKLAKDQEWAAEALGLDVNAPKQPDQPLKIEQFKHLAPAPQAAGPTKDAAAALEAKRAKWKGIPPTLKPMLEELHIEPDAWKGMVGDMAGMAPDIFCFTYKIDRGMYDQLKVLVTDAYRDPANFTPLPKDLDTPIRGTLGLGPKDVIPQVKLDVMAQDEASLSSKEFQKKYHLDQQQYSALTVWLAKSNRLIPRKVDQQVMAYDGTIMRESEYEDYLLRKRIEAIHVPSGIGAVASVVARAFTDDERIIGTVGAVGDLVETGASGLAMRPHEEVRPTGGYAPIPSKAGIKGGPNEQFLPTAPRPALPSSGEWTPPAKPPAASVAEPKTPAAINPPANVQAGAAFTPPPPVKIPEPPPAPSPPPTTVPDVPASAPPVAVPSPPAPATNAPPKTWAPSMSLSQKPTQPMKPLSGGAKRSTYTSTSKTTKPAGSVSQPEVIRPIKPSPDPSLAPDVATAGKMEAAAGAEGVAAEAYGKLPPSKQQKTVAAGAAPGATPKMSGSAHLAAQGEEAKIAEIEKHSKEIGHTLAPHVHDTAGKPGSYHAVHAEKQSIVERPNTPVAVTREMCPDCVNFFRREAAFQKHNQVVTDPVATRVFEPSGAITEHRKDGTVVRYEADGTVKVRPAAKTAP